MTTFTAAITDQLMLKQALSAALEKAINKALKLNVNDSSAFNTLAGKQLTLLLEELGFPLTFTLNNKQVLVTTLVQGDCTVTTSISTLKKIKASQQLTEFIKQDLLDIQGDLKIAQQYLALAESIEIDWQSELANHIGDIPTYQLSRVANFAQKKLNFAKTQIQADLTEWLIHEQKLIVSSVELKQFNQQVAQTAEQFDVLQQRLIKITKHLNEG